MWSFQLISAQYVKHMNRDSMYWVSRIQRDRKKRIGEGDIPAEQTFILQCKARIKGGHPNMCVGNFMPWCGRHQDWWTSCSWGLLAGDRESLEVTAHPRHLRRGKPPGERRHRRCLSLSLGQLLWEARTKRMAIGRALPPPRTMATALADKVRPICTRLGRHSPVPLRLCGFGCSSDSRVSSGEPGGVRARARRERAARGGRKGRERRRR